MCNRRTTSTGSEGQWPKKEMAHAELVTGDDVEESTTEGKEGLTRALIRKGRTGAGAG